jgi:PHP family Zn ribbon phosphoesterase
MTIPTLAKGAKEKGLQILGTGDATQPQWLEHLKSHLRMKNDIYSFEQIAFIPTVEIEDVESIHHLILLPDFEAVESFRIKLRSCSPNLDNEWGGRPRVNIQGDELAGLVRDAGGLIGPAHAFTPFKSIFRENKHTNLKSCYGDETENIYFIELGLSADSEIADCIPELREITYLTSSDAHSPGPDKLGREFTRFVMESPTFLELKLALTRKKGRRSVLNVGLDPRLGKYYLSFCTKCRRTLVIQIEDEAPSFDELNIYIHCRNESERNKLIRDISKRKIPCPVDGNPLRLGVRDRAAAIGEGVSRSPPHRPRYLRIAPLLDIITTALMVKSPSSKSARKLYKRMREELGSETSILTDVHIEKIHQINERLASMIKGYREGSACYEAGGGGRYGRLIPPWECESH